MHYNRHIIRNFPKNYPLWKKIWANILFFIGGTIIHPRKNLLTIEDLKLAKKNLQKGDIVLVGGLKRFSSLIIHGPITHAMMYIGNREFIHSVADGVEIDGMHSIFCEYDTMLILRAKTKSPKKLKKAIALAKKKIGQPFDFEFEDDEEKYYCSELLNMTQTKAGIKNGLPKHGIKSIHPSRFLNRHFKPVFISHNLRIKNGKIELLDEQQELKDLRVSLESA